MFPEPSPPSTSLGLDPPQRDDYLTRRRAAGEVLLCSGYPTQLAIVGLLGAIGISPIENGELSPRFVFAVSSLDTAVLIGLVLTFLKLSNERPHDVFFGERAPMREFGVGLLLVPALFILVGVVQLIIRAVAPYLHNVPVNPFETLLSSPAMRAAFITLVVIAGGVREEVQRAFLLHRFEQRLGGGRVGLVVTSLAFGLGHTLQGWDAAIVTTMLGALWGLVYFARRGVVANVISHGTFNVVQVLAGLSSVARS